MKSFKREYIMMLMIVLLVSSSDALFSRKRVRMRISNGVKDNRVLNLLCRSGDDDFGVKTLMYQQFFEFSFKPNILGRTVFNCEFANDKLHVDKIDVYGGRRDGLKCHACFWEFQEKGLCLGETSNGPFNDCRVLWNDTSTY
ncbi:S-protein homolog 3-like [Mercurialis annua]|uniref:S-protein homolog 3-like n=1 Tax=Mercurialis annua TaxID=3986 RepID=UPI0021607945|nr:S-protein homolog 3-like [Mercurialis annua]